MQTKYVNLFYQAKKLPVGKAKSYDIFKNMIKKSVDEVIEADEKIRQELGMTENLGFEPVPEE